MSDRIGQQLANYRLISLLGQGGFADVYLGEHVYLNTPAAIKVLQMRLTDDDKRNFLEEARTIARLRHPSIVRILEYDVVESIPFLVMEYAPNGTLRQCHPKGTVLPPSAIVPYVRHVAAALQYAHDRKFIHRDVKPENMLLGYKNAVLLSDFGLAVIVQSSRDRLQTVAGTVTYMAPEQLQGKACPASDQYALAAVVYEWLSGERLFSGSFIEVATQHVLVPPPSLRDKLPALPPAIDQVIQKGLAKSPEQRFASVLEFASAFERVCQAEASKQFASAAAPMGKLFTKYRKHSTAVLQIAWSPDGKKIASASADKTVHIWNATSKTPVLIYRNHSRPVSAVAWSPDGKRVVSGSWDTTVQVWNVQTGRKLLTCRGFSQEVSCVAWSPDGKYIACGSLDTTVQVRQADSGSRPYTHAGHTGPVHAVAWSPTIPSSPLENGWRIASASGAAVNADVDNTVQLWNALSGDDLLIYRDHFYFVNAVAWSPDGKKIASASADTNVQVWNVATGSNILTYRGHSSKVNAVAWSPNGKRIASASDDRTVQIWDATTGETIFTYRGHTKEVSSVAWSPNGTRIASAGYDATVHVWNVE
ncbi:MAG TPA: serine/threonine-protein kinase [Ktedonobacteraceae bacterium]